MVETSVVIDKIDTIVKCKNLENESIELFSKLNSLLDDKGQELLFTYDSVMYKIYLLKVMAT